MNELRSFSKWRRVFWPIHRHEIAKLLPMLAMGFFICFNYSLLRNLKDSLVVTNPQIGAEIIPFLKVWGILPGAVFVTALYASLCRHLSHQRVTLIMIGGFMLFYNLFAFVLYPMRDHLHPHDMADLLMGSLPSGMRIFVAMFRYWTLTLFYIAAELWSTMILSVLFWGFANEITKLSEARRFYGLIGVASSLATSAAGWTGNHLVLEHYMPSLPFGSDAWEQSLMILVGLSTAFGIFSMWLYYYMSERNKVDPLFQGDPDHLLRNKKAKRTFSVSQSFYHLSQSPYLRDIAIMVLSYNLVINLCEVVWKGQIGLLYPEKAEYLRFMSSVTTFIGLTAAVAALLIPGVIRSFGWTKTALITPLLLLVTSIVFFALFFVPPSVGSVITGFFSTTPLFLIVMTGAVQNVLSRSSKYSIFDVTKEMAFIPLNHESRLKGKAAIDGVASRFGKSGGSIMMQVLIISLGSLPAATPVIACIIILVIGSWLTTTLRLGKRFRQISEEPGAQEVGIELRAEIEREKMETSQHVPQTVTASGGGGRSG